MQNYVTEKSHFSERSRQKTTGEKSHEISRSMGAQLQQPWNYLWNAARNTIQFVFGTIELIVMAVIQVVVAAVSILAIPLLIILPVFALAAIVEAVRLLLEA